VLKGACSNRGRTLLLTLEGEGREDKVWSAYGPPRKRRSNRKIRAQRGESIDDPMTTASKRRGGSQAICRGYVERQARLKWPRNLIEGSNQAMEILPLR